jgi:hypothetical protein
MSDWRMQAQYETECPHCGDLISVSTWIVDADDYDTWCHAVCPRDLVQREPIPATTTEIILGQ